MEAKAVHDQDYFLLRDGRILVAHGWAHPAGFVVGELAFVPDKSGDFILLGNKYRKAYVKNGRGISERLRETVRDISGTCYDNAQPFSYKSIVSQSQVVHRIDTSWPSSRTEHGNDSAAEYVQGVVSEARIILGTMCDTAQVGLTGSLRISWPHIGSASAHDADLVFRETLDGNYAIADRLSSAAKKFERHRLYEHGKGWKIRLRTNRGILCSFFSYKTPSQAPFSDIRSIRPICSRLTARGTVTDDCYNSYLPTVLRVRPRRVTYLLPQECREELVVIISHMRSRGDFFRGDEGLFTGCLIEVETGTSSYLALSVTEAGESLLLTPPWHPY